MATESLPEQQLGFRRMLAARTLMLILLQQQWDTSLLNACQGSGIRTTLSTCLLMVSFSC